MAKFNKYQNEAVKNRFSTVGTDEVTFASMPVYASATIKGADSAWRAFCDWKGNADTVEKKELGEKLCTFILAHRRLDGKVYKSQSLLTIIRSIVRKAFLMKQELRATMHNAWNFDKDEEFASARNVIDRRMTELQ